MTIDDAQWPVIVKMRNPLIMIIVAAFEVFCTCTWQYWKEQIPHKQWNSLTSVGKKEKILKHLTKLILSAEERIR